MKTKFLALVALLTASVSALADPVAIATTDAVTQIGNAQTALLAVGSAIIVLAGVSMGIRWVKATFF
jgi:hypothetical protein